MINGPFPLWPCTKHIMFAESIFFLIAFNLVESWNDDSQIQYSSFFLRLLSQCCRQGVNETQRQQERTWIFQSYLCLHFEKEPVVLSKCILINPIWVKGPLFIFVMMRDTWVAFTLRWAWQNWKMAQNEKPKSTQMILNQYYWSHTSIFISAFSNNQRHIQII